MLSYGFLSKTPSTDLATPPAKPKSKPSFNANGSTPGKAPNSNGKFKLKKSTRVQRRRWRRFFFHPYGKTYARLTREGYQFVFLMSFAIIAAVIQNVNLLVLLGGALGGMLLIQWRLCSRSLFALRYQRSLPKEIEARRPFLVDVTIKNPRPWLGSWWINVLETVSTENKARSNKIQNQTLLFNMERILPQSTSAISYECTCATRGEYRLLRPELSTRFPLGLMRGIRHLDEDTFFLVHPTLGQMVPNWRAALELPRLGQQTRALPISGGDGEFFGLRKYRSGDAMRLIHWRSSAKRNELLVRQFERQENYELALVLDLTEPKRSDWKAFARALRASKEDPAQELSDIATELITTMTRTVVSEQAGSVMLTIIDGKDNHRFRMTSVAQMPAVLDRLSVAALSSRANFENLFSASFDNLSPRTPTVVVSLRAKDEAQIDRLSFIKDAPARLQNIRWVNVSNDEWQSLFRRGFLNVS